MAMLLLFASLARSYFNIPVAQLPEQRIFSGEDFYYFGMHYVVPSIVEWPGTVIAVNVGGAVISVLISLYLLAKHGLWERGLMATACRPAAGAPACCFIGLCWRQPRNADRCRSP